MQDVKPLLLTKAEAADYLRCSKRMVDDLLASGDLKAVRIGRRLVRIEPRELARFVASCREHEGA